ITGDAAAAEPVLPDDVGSPGAHGRSNQWRDRPRSATGAAPTLRRRGRGGCVPRPGRLRGAVGLRLHLDARRRRTGPGRRQGAVGVVPALGSAEHEWSRTAAVAPGTVYPG